MSAENMSKATQNFVDRCKTLFHEADADGSGALKPRELKDLIEKLTGQEASREVWTSIFADLDDDADRLITWDEFSDVCMNKDPKSIKKCELKEVFKKYDRDCSGKLTADEIRQVFQEAGVDDDAEEAIGNADKDGDGKISCEEFLNIWGDH